MIRQNVVNRDNVMSILEDNWRSFIAEYELKNIGIGTLKSTIGVDDLRIN